MDSPKKYFNDNHYWDFASFPEFEYDEKEHMRKHRERFELFHKKIAGMNTRKILDIGCSTGIFYKDLPEREKYEIHGVDVVPEFIELANKRGILGKICDIDKEPLPYGDNEFDLVVFDSLLEHTLRPISILNEAVRVLKSGGYFFLVTPNAVNLRSRWNCLVRGGNPFWPLIDELSNNRGHLKRCSVFYSIKEILYVLPKDLIIEEIIFKNKKWGGKTSFMLRMLYSLTYFFKELRDTILVIAGKK